MPRKKATTTNEFDLGEGYEPGRRGSAPSRKVEKGYLGLKLPVPLIKRAKVIATHRSITASEYLEATIAKKVAQDFKDVEKAIMNGEF